MTQREFDILLRDAVSRKHKKLSFETVYSHEIILIWLQEILPAWLIHIPETGVSTLSEWPKMENLGIALSNGFKNRIMETPTISLMALVNPWRIISAPKCLKIRLSDFVNNMK